MERRPTKSYNVSAYKDFADSQAQLTSSQSGARTAEMLLLQKVSILHNFVWKNFFFFWIWDFFVFKIELLTAYDVQRTL